MLKKISAAVLIAAVAIGCTACGAKDSKDTDPAIPSEQSVSEGSAAGNMGSVTGKQIEDFGSGTAEHSESEAKIPDKTGTDAEQSASSEENTGSLEPSIQTEGEGEDGSLNSNGFTLTFGDYKVTVEGCKETLDINNCHALRVEYEFTNNSDAQATFGTSILTTATQGTYRLANTSPSESDSAYSAQLKFVPPGDSITCASYFLLDDTSTDVIINIANMLSSTDSISLTYSFKH